MRRELRRDANSPEASPGNTARRQPSQEEGRREVIAHLVLLTPRPELTAAERAAAIGVLARAAADVPEILRFKIGKRIRHGLPGYEQLPQAVVRGRPHARDAGRRRAEAILECARALALGHLFATATAEAAAYDYEIVDAAQAGSLWAADNAEPRS